MENKIIHKIDLAVNSRIEQIISSYNISSLKQRETIKSILKSIYRFDQNIFNQAKSLTISKGYVEPNDDSSNIEGLLQFLIKNNKRNIRKWKLLQKASNINTLSVFWTYYKTVFASELTKNYLDILFKKRSRDVKSVCEKISQAIKVEELMGKLKAIGGIFWDLAPSGLYKLDTKFLNGLISSLNRFIFTKQVADILGRMASANKSFEKKMINEIKSIPGKKIKLYSPSNLQGITHGNNIGDVLPHVLGYRSKEILNKLFKKQFVEKQLKQFEKTIFQEEFKTIETLKENQISLKGPFVIVVDTSGSMQGTPEQIAKAMALSIVNIVAKENRKCTLVAFSTTSMSFDASDIKNNWTKFYDFLSTSFYGGTDINLALEESIKIARQEEYRNSDILFISDMQIGGLSKETISEVSNLKKQNVKFYSLTIGNNFSDVNIDFLDKNWIYDGTKESVEKIIYDINTINKHYN